MFLRDALKGNLHCALFGHSFLLIFPLKAAWRPPWQLSKETSWNLLPNSIISGFFFPFFPTTHLLLPSPCCLFSTSFLFCPLFTVSYTLALALKLLCTTCSSNPISTPFIVLSPEFFPLFSCIALFFSLPHVFFLTFISEVLFVIFITLGNDVILCFGPFLFVSQCVCNFLKCLLQGHLLFFSLFVAVCLTLGLSRPLSGGVAGAEGAAHRPTGGAGDHRKHWGGLLFQRLLRHGTARTGGQILSVWKCYWLNEHHLIVKWWRETCSEVPTPPV